MRHGNIRERKGPAQGVMQNCEPQERSVGSKFGERTQKDTLKQERCARRESWDLAKKCLQAQKKGGKGCVLLSCRSVGNADTLSSTKPEEHEFVVDSGASVHMLSKTDLSSGELETLRRSRNATTVVTANGEVQTNEEAQVLCSRSSSLCDCAVARRHACRPLDQWSKATFDQRWEENPMQDGELCSPCGPGTFIKFPHKFTLDIAPAGFMDSSSSLNPANSRSYEGAPEHWHKGAAGNR